MGLNKYKLGELLALSEEKNTELKYEISDVKGVSIKKVFIETKARMDGVSLYPYLLVKPNYFAYVPVTSRNGNKITIAHNKTDETYIVSSSYIVFYVSKQEILDANYLFMYFNRAEFDRFSRFNSWGSAREVFSWDEMCNIEIELPSLSVQQKYVDIYRSMQKNLNAMNRGIRQMQSACDVYMEKLLKMVERQPIGKYIREIDVRNEDLGLGKDDVRGISTQKEFIPTKANLNSVSLANYKIVHPSKFAYVSDTSRRGDKISLAYNRGTTPYLVSSITTLFEVFDEAIVPEYLFMFLRRPEFDRYARYNSWGSARETITWEDLGRLEIPIPDKEVQQGVVSIFESFINRQAIVERLTSLQKNICPVLIRGAIEEGQRL